MSDYKDLVVWKKAHLFTIKIYKETADFPKEEKYGIISQLRRATASIPTNIVEGKGSSYDKKLSRYLDIARGSAQEVEYLLLLSRDLGYLTEEVYKDLNKECISILQMLTKFKKSIDTK